MTPKVSIIIPTFNKWNLTQQCLANIETATKTVPHEIIVVDNASTDGTQDELKQWRCSQANGSAVRKEVILFEKNLNFSGACNAGADMAKTEYLMFLNNDTIPFEGWLNPLVEELDTNTYASIVGSKLCFPDGTIQHAGVAFMRENRFPYHPYRGFDCNHPAVNHRREVQCVTGAALLARRHIFEIAGKFDERYRNGGEDIHLCLKARHYLGSKIVYRHDSTLIHLESQSPGRFTFNRENCDVFYSAFRDLMIADEDAFYYEDGFHRVGFRAHLAGTELAGLPQLGHHETDDERQYWLSVAYCQRNIVNHDYAKAGMILDFVDDWPDDYPVREWAAEVAAHLGHFKAAYQHYSIARKLRDFSLARECTTKLEARTANKFLPFK